MENNGETVGMKYKPSRKPSKLTGSQKQQCNCEPFFAYTRALEIHALGVNKREGQNNYHGNCYCVGWAARIKSFLLLPSAVVASPDQFQEGCLTVCCLPFLPSICLLRRRWPRPLSLLEKDDSWIFPRQQNLSRTQPNSSFHPLSNPVSTTEGITLAYLEEETQNTDPGKHRCWCVCACGNWNLVVLSFVGIILNKTTNHLGLKPTEVEIDWGRRQRKTQSVCTVIFS